MMRLRREPNGKGRLPTICLAQRDGQCACGSTVFAGDTLYIDPFTNVVRCLNCAKCTPAATAKSMNDYQDLRDAVARLEHLPVRNPQQAQELAKLQETLAAAEKRKQQQQTAQVDLLQPQNPVFKIMIAKYAGRCTACRCFKHVGSKIVWHTKMRRIWCLSCNPMMSA
jgi:hypothetical protein